MKTFPFFIFRINKSNEKSTFLLKGEGRVINKGKVPPNPYSFIYLFKKKKKKRCPFLTHPIDIGTPFTYLV